MNKQYLIMRTFLLCNFISISTLNAQNFIIYGDISQPRQRLLTEETGSKTSSFFTTTASLRRIGTSIRLNKHLWTTIAYAKHREFIQYAPYKKSAARESILKSINYYGGVYTEIKLWR
jgi:hypothetical protein